MSQSIISFRYEVSGVLTDVDAVVVEDPGNTYGVKRTDTNAVVVAAGVALQKISTGLYRLTFTDPAPNLTYNYWLKWTADGEDQSAEFTMQATARTTPSCAYLTYEMLIVHFGAKNVRIASNKDNTNADPDYDAIQDALDHAVEEINSELLGGPYVIPLDFTPNNGSIPKMVEHWTAVIAYYTMCLSRGFDEKKEVMNKVRQQYRDQYAEIAAIKAGFKEMRAARDPLVDMSVSVVTTANVMQTYGLLRYPDGAVIWSGIWSWL